LPRPTSGEDQNSRGVSRAFRPGSSRARPLLTGKYAPRTVIIPSQLYEPSVKRDPVQLEKKPFDLIVLGGGINGAGIARDAALRGLSVALIDKGDFASGTSSRSSKLLHGGIRYLEQLRVGLVRQALRERETILRTAPLVTHPVKFLVPVYRGDPRGAIKIRIGLAAYDRLAGPARIERSRFLPPAGLMEMEPSIERAGLRGAGSYTDAVMDDARLCFLNILDACRAGASCVNYVKATGFLRTGGAITGVQAVDRLTERKLSIRGKIVVNACGPWADKVSRLDPEEHEPDRLRPTKGVHVVVPLCLSGHALLLSAHSDGRVLFVIPWGEVSIIGTTDTDYEGDPDEVSVEPSDVDYLLREAGRVLPRAKLDRSSVLFAYAGVRPLVKSRAARPWEVSREHRIIEHSSGLISVLGGKYTTYRALAEQVVDRVVRRPGMPSSHPCRTASRPLPGAETDDLKTYTADRTAFWRERLPGCGRQVAFLLGRYGTESEKILELAERDRRLLQPVVGGVPHVLAEIVHANQHEMAVTLEDVVRRRLGLSLLGVTEETVERRMNSVIG
jgi:glycerol-3-phosphate dehydrogenase